MNFGRAGADFTSGGDARRGLNPIDVRQLQGNAQQYAREMQDLRRNLQQSGGTATDLREVDEAIRRLQELSKAGDPLGRQELMQQALEKIRGVEFSLRKRLDTTSDALYLAGADEAPAEFRPMVEEYTRRLSRPAASPAAAAPGR